MTHFPPQSLQNDFEQAKNFFLLGLENYQKEQYEESEKYLLLSLNILPDRLNTLINLSAVLIKLDKFENASEIIARAITLYPTDAALFLNQGQIFTKKHNWENALKSYDRAIELKSNYAEAHLNRGVVLQELKRLEESLASYDKAIELDSDYGDAKINRELVLQQLNLSDEAMQMGALAAQTRQFDSALEQLYKALEIDISNTYAYYNLGNVFFELERLEESLASYDKAINLKPDYAEAYSNRGNVLTKLKRFEESLVSFDAAIELDPGYAEAYSNRGNVLSELKRFEESLASHDKALSLKPDSAEAHYNIGNLFKEIKYFEKSLASYDKAIELKSNYAEAYSNRGVVLNEVKRLEESLASYDKAIEFKPDYAEAYSNRGVVLTELRRFKDSLASYDIATALDPDYAEAYWNKSHLLLSLQDFESGWQIYDWRWKNASLGLTSIASHKPKLSSLENISDKKILIWAEQGIGDQVLYSSMMNQLLAIAPLTQVLLDKRLFPLFNRSIPQAKFIDKNIDIDKIEYDQHLPIADLGKFFRNKLSDFHVSQDYYLTADKQRASEIRSSLIKDKKIVCGITWNSKIEKIGAEKSIQLEDLLPILRIKDISFVSLQYGDIHEQLENFNEKHDLNIQVCESVDNFNDIDGHAALIEACDFVLSISNTTAHISGAIGKETFLMCPSGKALLWYWSNRDDGKSIWYPSIHIYEQNVPGQWSDVVGTVKLEIEKKLTTALH